MSFLWRLRFGMGAPARLLRRRISLALFGAGVDGLDVVGIIPLKELGVDGPGRVSYVPSAPSFLWRALHGLPVTVNDVFVDYGCGKGGVVVQAAVRYPFRKVIGVEISEQLTRVASENVVRASHRFKAGTVEVVLADAESWPLPDETTYVYMYKPFYGPLFETVLDRIVESLDRRPRGLTLIYANPVQEEAILSTGRFKRIRASRGFRRDPQLHVHVYVSDPAHGSDPASG